MLRLSGADNTSDTGRDMIKEGDQVRFKGKGAILYIVLIKHWHDGPFALCRDDPDKPSSPGEWLNVRDLEPVGVEGAHLTTNDQPYGTGPSLAELTTANADRITELVKREQADDRNVDSRFGDSQITREPSRGISDAVRKDIHWRLLTDCALW